MLATCALIEIEPGKDSLVYRGSAAKGVPKVCLSSIDKHFSLITVLAT